ncbi:MAG: class I SAM-dependent rRNA methyltransferase, partial [Verrucomicrobiota bacterium]
LRRALVDSEATTAFRLIHGAADGWPDLYVDRLGEFLLAQSERPLSQAQVQRIEACSRDWNIRGVFHKTLLRQIRAATPSAITPKLILGEAPAAEFVVRENGVEFLLSFQEGYSIGLFLDQRDNRRRLLARHVAAQFDLGSQPAAALDILNVFSYTCAFSVCAARAGGRTTSLDLSKKYLEWGRRNFAQNGIDPAAHDFIYGDALDWMSRLARKNRQFDLVLLDPPTFSRSKTQGTFQATRDYAKLANAAAALLKPEGVLFASTNAAELKPERFLEMIEDGIKQAGREIAQQQFYPQPPDFPITRAEPGYLKTVWMRVAAAR